MTLSFDVTRHKLVLGPDRNGTTGWYDVSYTESTIEAIIQDRGATTRYLPAGVHVSLDGLMMTADPVVEGDQIEHSATRFYEVKTVKEVNWLDSFVRRDCDLTLLPAHDLSYDVTAPSAADLIADPNLYWDARLHTRAYWIKYLDDDNLQNFSWITCYSDPPYPLIRVFKDKFIDLIFTVSQATTIPLMGTEPEPYGYEEHVPTHVVTLDTKLIDLCELELRRIIKDYPEGSRRTLDRRTSTVIQVGSTPIYDTEFILNYRRLTA